MAKKSAHTPEPPAATWDDISAPDLALKRGLPAAPEIEKYCLGSILQGREEALELKPEDYSLEKNRRIYSRILDLKERGTGIDYVTLSEELMRQGQLEAVDGLAYVVSLTEGLPELAALPGYVEIVREKSRLRQIIFTSQSAIQKALLEQSRAEDISETAGRALEEIGAAPDKNAGHTPEEIVTAFPGGVGAFLDPTLREKGLPTPFGKLTEVLGGGFRAGELIVLAARPSMGKSAMALNMTSHLVLHKRPVPVAFFSLEMTGASLLTRLVCGAARVDQHKFRAGYLNQDERRRLQVGLSEFTGAPLRIFDQFGISMPEIGKHIKNCVKQDGAGIVFVDYLGLIAVKHRTENRNLELAQMTRQFKAMTEEFKIPIVILSQLSRANEKRPGDKRPILSDLRESGAIENDADTVMFIHREEMYNREREDIKGLAELIVAKQRSGPTTIVNLRFLGGLTKFENRAEDIFDQDLEEASEPEPPGPPPEW